jgi:phosphoglycerate dehydrogenase-like enzyme
MNSPDANANTTAEHALALLFALARSIPAADASLRAGKWDRAKFVGTELAGKTLGVLGGGNIGRRVARKAKALGLDVIVFDPYLAKDALADERISVVTLSELCARANIVTIHVPKTDATANLVDADLLASMKKGVRIVNCARGGIVDEAALAAAITRGHVAGAAIDVFETEPPTRDNPLLQCPGVVVTPHLGASTTEAQERASLEICQQVLAYLTDHVIANAVNLPRIRPETLRELAPWIELSTRLGQVVAALGRGPQEVLEIGYQGHLSAAETSPMTRAIVAAVLSTCAEGPVNWINAPTLAAERGLTVRESRLERVRDFASMITVTLSSGARGTTTVAGTLFGPPATAPGADRRAQARRHPRRRTPVDPQCRPAGRGRTARRTARDGRREHPRHAFDSAEGRERRRADRVECRAASDTGAVGAVLDTARCALRDPDLAVRRSRPMIRSPKKMFIPGPTEVHPDVLTAMTHYQIGHRTQEMRDLVKRVKPGLRKLFGTKGDVFLSTSSATCVMEGALTNPGEDQAARTRMRSVGRRSGPTPRSRTASRSIVRSCRGARRTIPTTSARR